MGAFSSHSSAIVSVILGFLLLRGSCVENLTALFVFGDSLVDAGNNNYIVTLAKANLVPNGIDFLPSQKPTGRYTNGRTVADILGQELGLGLIPPYLAPSTAGAAVLNGVNYASGGAGILNKSGEIFVGRINLDAQIDNYANTRQDIISGHGVHAVTYIFRKALFLIVIGSNDFLDNYFTPIISTPERATVPPQVFVEAMISKYRLQLTRLYNMDARKIVLTNVGPIGCIPFSRDINPLAGTNCVVAPNHLAQLFNRRLKDLVMELSSSLEGVIIVYANVSGIVSDIIQNYELYGFEVVDSACCFLAGRFGGLVPCGPTSKICLDRSKYFFWDPYHPSDAANIIIAKRTLDGGSYDIFPMNVRQLAQA